MTATRSRIDQAIEATPGVHFNELVRRLDLAPGQVQYHIRRLLNAGSITRERLYGRTQYYPRGYDEVERATLALLRRETARDILLYLIEHGRSRPDNVATALGIARSTLEWHLGHLMEQDLVTKHHTSAGIELDAHNREVVTNLLREIHLSPPERMTDRFERLVDRLLDG